MKYIILLLFPTLLFAAFTPFTGNPPADSITATGNLLTKNATAQTNFAACPDGEFLIWDDSAADGTGMVCSGTGVKFGIDVDATFTNILHMNKGSGVSKHSGMFMYMDGSTSIGSYLYHNASGKLYLGTSSSVNNVAITAGDVERLTINGTNGAVVITDTGGNGGNVPHGCTLRSSVAAGSDNSVDCVGDEIITGGGCSNSSGAVLLSRTRPNVLSGSATQWQCYSSGITNITAYAFCCQY